MTKITTYIAFFIALNAVGLNGDQIGVRAQRLVTYFAHNHLKPREMNDDFGVDLHRELIEYLDNKHVFLLQSDVDQLEAMSKGLDDEVREASINYLETAEKLLMQRLIDCRDFWESLAKENLSVIGLSGNMIEMEEFAKTQDELNNRWTNYFNKVVQLDLLKIASSDGEFNLGKIKSEEASIRQTALLKLNNFIERRCKTEDYFELMYLNAIAHCYDPHSSYFNTEMKREFTEELSAEREIFGINTSTRVSGEIEITSIIPGSSAWFSKSIEEGDIITRVSTPNGESLDVTKADIEVFSKFLDQTDVIVLDVKNNKGEKNVELTRGRVYSDEDAIKSALLKGKIAVGYISLPDFYTNWTDTSALGCANDIAKSLLKMRRESIDGLILDLRGNGGGSIKEAIDLVGIFINYGPVSIEESYEGNVHTYKDFNRGAIYRGPLIIMVDSESASASEIVAGSLQDYNRALIVGKSTFGKATGQVIVSLDPAIENGSGFIEDASWGYVKITNIGLYRLTKKSAQQVGVIPDIELDLASSHALNHEVDLPHSIRLDSVVKKVYFTPKLPFPINELISGYSEKKEMKIAEMQEKSDSLILISQLSKKSLDLYKCFEYHQLQVKLENDYQSLVEAVDFGYTPESMQFKKVLLNLSPYLKNYNDRFLNELSKDIELNETFKIMESLIEHYN
ncbi:MAG: S41 family peptidase [Crocinitomicaceae bacterium]|nr:S41 family peptidase [Crocinitomicaceae bacterium]